MIADIVGNRTLKSQWDETVSLYGENLFLKFISVQDEISSFTYEAFDRNVKQSANLLLSLGIQKGDFVGLHLHNRPEYLACWLAIAQIGAVSIPINEHFQAGECSYIIQKCSISHLIAEPCSIGIYLEHYDKFRLQTLILAGGESLDPRVVSLAPAMERQPYALTGQIAVGSEDTAVILFTSGTTRNPKGVVYTHANVVYGGLLHAEQICMRTGDRFLTAMPCYHMDFQEMAAAPVICTGSTLIMSEHYSARRFWRQIYEHKADFTDTMSIMNRTLMMQPVQPWEKDHCLKQVYFSMGLSDEEKTAFEERFGVRLLNSYGMTETVSAVTCVPPWGSQHWPSVGRPALSYEIKIVDEQGNTLPAGTEGEICVHGVPGRSLVKGYYQEEEATSRLLDPEGWLHSGDWGYLDEEGWLFFLGRCGHIIKRAGENISCTEVESVLTSHPLVADAAVIGVPDPIRGQAVKAFLQLNEGCTATEEEIIHYCEERLAYFKIPTQLAFVTEFPRTATGKIKKNLLNQEESQ